VKLRITFSCLIFFVNFSYSQDTIKTRNGALIEGEVIEITQKTIRYYRNDQPEGPVRNIAIKEVREIQYEDGTKEVFVLVESDSKEEIVMSPSLEAAYASRKRRDSIMRYKDRIFESGIFVDLLLGYGYLVNREYVYEYIFQYQVGSELTHSYEHYGGFNIRFGNKWYFGKGDVYRPGIQATWLRAGIFTSTVANAATGKTRGIIAPLGIGFANSVKLKRKMGIELNLNVGPTVILPDNNSSLQPIGLIYGVALKYRWNQLVLGLDFSQVEEGLGELTKQSFSNLNVTLGLKF
jgi:hypothetical protein